ncbi:MAG: hypothetical protein II180_03570, partial [Proteobacteria bacterium]|nr:hypothetical protein [Pseudomonadota bacterium]
MKRYSLLSILFCMVCGMSACTEGQKTPSTSDCLATDPNVCIGTGTYAFCINGKWQSAFCPNGTSCTNGACVPLPPDTPYVPDALKAVLTDSDAAYCTEPFFWAESDFETFYGIPFSRFRPA